MKRALLALPIVIAGLGSTAAIADNPAPAQTPGPTDVVSTETVTPPDHRLVERHFTPWDNPSVGQIHQIARSEQKRWGGPSILGRIACESGYRPKVVNGGGYAGLLQFGPVWGSMYAVTPRKVKLVTYETDRVPVLRTTTYGDGHTTTEKIDNIRQRVKIVREGMLPKDASPLHGYAAIRVGQRAVSGDGPGASWSCGL